MPNHALNLTGQTFGRLTAIRPDGYIGRNVAWLFQCTCGNTKRAVGPEVKRGKTQSCGCLLKENGRRTIVHGLYETPEYTTWTRMRNRCNNPNHHAYDRYGGRGIKVCAEWDDFVTFLNDMGPKPTPEHSLDRINNDGDYEPSNCRWATKLEQTHNRRDPVQKRRLYRILRDL